MKADSIQRLQAALKNEYLEAKDVKFAITNIEKVEEKFTAVLIYSRLEAEKKMAGKLFRYDFQAKDVHQGLIRRVKRTFMLRFNLEIFLHFLSALKCLIS